MDVTKQLLANLRSQSNPIGVVGLGYVGLPLACLLAEKFKVVGFDIKQTRIDELKSGHDRTGEVEEKAKLLNPNLTFTADKSMLGKCQLMIVAVPTPVDDFRVPDLSPLVAASKTVGSVMQKGTIVVYESTVYPGVTEKVCGKHLAETSGLKMGVDFFLGYSPERVNPGDKEHTIDKIRKVVAGATPEITEMLASVYGSVITAGTYSAANIQTAEAAKVIENTQRDLNIALVNELSMLFDKIGLDTLDVLAASGTKWNFLPFKPGLVGGHCIGVDPYYLTYMADGLGFHTQVISAGRRINDGMGNFVAQKCLSMILGSKGGSPGQKPRVGIMGVTFKENVPDVRNTKVISVAEALESFGAETFMVDPVADAEEFEHEYKRKLVTWEALPQCDALIFAVKHDAFMREFPLDRLMGKLSSGKLLLDLKGAFDRKEAARMGVQIWRM
jgi:UDP-N-acetyl-D-glucosamine/UDP-N-acetyl-D-galactosamine dehydrogenase